MKPRRAGTFQEQDVCCQPWKIHRGVGGSDPHFYTHDEESFTKQSIIKPQNDDKKESECPICCEVRPLISLMKKCKHPPACRECLHEIYVSQAQQNVSNYPLQCYHPECTKPILASQLINHGVFRSDEEIQKHHRLSMLSKAYSDSGRLVAHCPDCDFPRLVRNQEKAHCKKCGSNFEITRDANHSKKSTIEALKAIKRDKIGHNYGWTFCPGCKMIVSKGDGCDHMTCVCGEEFYWDEVAVNPAINVSVAARPEPPLMKPVT